MVQRTATSAGAIILREVEGKLKVALAHHPRTTKSWVLPKGHVEAGETLEQAALAGRKALFIAREPDWANYLLYGGGNLRLVTSV